MKFPSAKKARKMFKQDSKDREENETLADIKRLILQAAPCNENTLTWYDLSPFMVTFLTSKGYSVLVVPEANTTGSQYTISWSKLT